MTDDKIVLTEHQYKAMEAIEEVLLERQDTRLKYYNLPRSITRPEDTFRRLRRKGLLQRAGKRPEDKYWERWYEMVYPDNWRDRVHYKARKPSVSRSERFFQTKRIQVLTHDYRREYRLAIVDMHPVPHIVSEWCRLRGDPQRGYWMGLQEHPDGAIRHHRNTYGTKKSATIAAKRQSEALGLAFDPKKDYVPYTDVERGPLQDCWACGKEEVRRSHGPVMCGDCEVALKIGSKASREMIEVALRFTRIVPFYYPDANDDGLRFAELLSDLLSSSEGPSDRSSWPMPIIPGGGKTHGPGSKGIGLMVPDPDLLAAFIAHLGGMFNRAKGQGYQEGRSILESLYQGGKSLTDASARDREMARLMQRKGDNDE
jgi:hypothetical protein